MTRFSARPSAIAGTPAPRAHRDEIAVLENAYQLDGTMDEWLAEVARAAAPLLDCGLGLGATVIERVANRTRFHAAVAENSSPAILRALANFMEHAEAETIDRGYSVYRRSPVEVFSDVLGGTDRLEADPASEYMYRCGVRDSLVVIGADEPFQVTLNVWLSDARRVAARFRARWTRIASHLGAAFRLRRSLADARSRLGSAYDGFAACDAIMTPCGKLEFANDAARRAHAALARAIVDTARSRGALRTRPDAALEAWRCLVAGRWSIVDYVDTDRKRFLVARRNTPTPPVIASLSLREVQVLSCRARGLSLKAIAYDLGLSITTVSRSLTFGLQNLGLRSEEELVGLFARPGVNATLTKRGPHATKER